MTHDPHSTGLHQTEVLEARFGLRVASLLHESAQDLPHDVSERLRVARLQAVEHARSRLARPQPARATALHVQHAGGGTATLGHIGGHLPVDQEPWWAWAGSLVPLLTLVLGLFAVSVFLEREDVQAAAQVDVALLSDDLPPAAYSDPGFTEFLASPAEAPEAVGTP